MAAGWTVAYAAEKLGCSESSVYQMVADGTLRCYRIGKRGIRFTDDALDAYIGGDVERSGVAS